MPINSTDLLLTGEPDIETEPNEIIDEDSDTDNGFQIDTGNEISTEIEMDQTTTFSTDRTIEEDSATDIPEITTQNEVETSTANQSDTKITLEDDGNENIMMIKKNNKTNSMEKESNTMTAIVMDDSDSKLVTTSDNLTELGKTTTEIIVQSPSIELITPSTTEIIFTIELEDGTSSTTMDPPLETTINNTQSNFFTTNRSNQTGIQKFDQSVVQKISKHDKITNIENTIEKPSNTMKIESKINRHSEISSKNSSDVESSTIS